MRAPTILGARLIAFPPSSPSSNRIRREFLMVVGGHSGTGFQNWRNSEFWNRVPGFNNLGESWEIVPVFGDISNPGTKFQSDALARGSESWNRKIALINANSR
jgi:hypothetical protein